ncbi:MAG: hypothetical protein HN521_02350 [Candidatus Latescibacteria bacterium]|nr:hypothetical protein [Candidatus Latescibacterota bacterium]
MVIYLADLAHTHSVNNASLTVPLNIGYIKAYAMAAHGESVDISLFKHPEELLARVEERKPDIVGLANYGWNANLNRAIGTYLRQCLPEALFVAGGPNIDPDPERRMNFLKQHGYLDFLVIDGGEETFSELIDWHRNGRRDFGALPSNLVWRNGETICDSGERTLTKVIENIPSPYLAGYLDDFLEAGMVPLFETNRGCPFQCTFCAWGSASKNLVRRFHQDISIAEIEYVGARSQSLNWIVCDANFGILTRDVEIAKAIRCAKDRYNAPQKCHIWLAKNVTERNLQIGEILGDMAVPVMAVQSLNDQVLKNIKRGNISTETYVEYQKKFHSIGSATSSDVIVPLPGETLDTHIETLHKLFDFDVDGVYSYNMRLLAGAETNATDTRQKYGFRRRYRLIHGDAGAYLAPNGTIIRCFEYEESPRETTTMSETELFYLRKLHFIVDFFWNTNVYKPLLKVLKAHGINPIDVMKRFIAYTAPSDGTQKNLRLSEFWETFDRMSHEEWFDTEEEIEAYFANEENFQRLLNQEFEKLNILFSVIVLRDYKQDFDHALRQVALAYGKVPEELIEQASHLTIATFPALNTPTQEKVLELPASLVKLGKETTASFQSDSRIETIRLIEGPLRQKIKEIILDTKGQTLSKVLNTQRIMLKDLGFIIEKTDVTTSSDQ